MKLRVIGLGQCGGRIADEFMRRNNRAKFGKGISIVTDAFAVNTDKADLAGLYHIKRDSNHRVAIGLRETEGHGVGKLNERAARIAQDEADTTMKAIGYSEGLYSSDAFLLIAGVGGGTGSGAMPVLAENLRQKYPQRTIYALAVLPTEEEEKNEERTVYNAATSLKATFDRVDALFLLDNEVFVKTDMSLEDNITHINRLAVAPFYNVLSAGEEHNERYVGKGKVLDAGDIKASLSGYTVVGHGRRPLGFGMKFKHRGKRLFGRRIVYTSDEMMALLAKAREALHEALDNLSTTVNPAEAGRGFYLLGAPAAETSYGIKTDLGSYLKQTAKDALIRSGDYPGVGFMGDLSVDIALSEIGYVERVVRVYEKAKQLMGVFPQREKIRQDLKIKMAEAAEQIPNII